MKKSAPRRTHRDEARPRVAILVDTSTQWSREIVFGINRYVQEHEDWHAFIEPRGSSEVLAIPQGWRGDGVIADIRDLDMAESLLRMNLPVVNVSSLALPPRYTFPQSTVDKAASCALAAQYFFDLGYRQFGYIDISENSWDSETRLLFAGEVRQRGGQCSLYEVKTHGWGTPDWNMSVRGLAGWLKKLPKPLALFSWAVGREVVYACKEADLRMPEEVALLLLGYDEIFSEMGHVPISGIRHAWDAIGYEAARQLSVMMSGAKRAPDSRYFAPITVETRRSSNMTAVSDPVVAQVMHYIQEHACDGLRVSELARQAGVSRRVLERRFQAELNQAPAEMIRNVRFEQAKKLLRDTNYPIPLVAERTGFVTSQYLANIFQKRMKLTPLRYRRQFRVVRDS